MKQPVSCTGKKQIWIFFIITGIDKPISPPYGDKDRTTLLTCLDDTMLRLESLCSSTAHNQ